MKKSMYFAAAAAVALASCSSDDVVQVNNGKEIQFSVVADNDSRAATVFCNNNLMPGFKVYAGYTAADGQVATFIEEDLITVLSDGKCTQSETRYWPENGTIDFYGLVNLNGDGYTLESASNFDSEIVWGTNTPIVKDFTPKADVKEQTDLLYAVATGQTASTSPVKMNFRHALSQIEFRAKNDNPALHVVVEAVRIGQTDAKGTYTLPAGSTEENLIDHTTDKDKDYADAHEDATRGTWSDVDGKADYHVPFDPVAVAYGELKDLTISTDGTQTNNNSLLLVPTMEDGVATVAWDPATDANTAYNGTYIAVKCKIYNVAGDSYNEATDIAVLHDGWAVIPASFKWKQGKKYIYTINFTKGGNGGYEETPVDPENPDVPGTPTDTPVLTGIEFQVTVDDFLYGDHYTNDMNTSTSEAVAVHNSDFVAKVTAGGSFVLNEDVTLDATLKIPAGVKVVLDLNGKTITNKVDNASTDVIVVAEGAELTINGDGAVTAVTGNDGYAIISKGVLTINGGTYRSGLDTKNDGNCTIYAMGNGKVYITGGDFSTTEEDTTTHIINKKDADRATTVIEISGGTFTNFNPGNNAAEGAGTNFLAAGYKSVETAEGSNVWTVVPDRD
ncbi:MAG: fimbrillin family protein [Muribaculaceae bacterium]|nr:fimbrillin family protein [Muribaculaceae bacterium]